MSYREMLESELQWALDKFVPLRRELYTPVAHGCVNSLCKGMYVANRRTTMPAGMDEIVLPVIDLRHGFEPESGILESERLLIFDIFIDFFFMGYRVAHEVGSYRTPLELIEAAEFVSERLGCQGYCGQALEYLLVSQKDGQKPS